MRKLFLFALILVLSVTLSYGISFARNTGNGAVSGSHFQFNIIGHPNNNFSGDDSKGRSIMIPLKTVTHPNYLRCEQQTEDIVFEDEIFPSNQSSAPTGDAKLHFDVCAACTNFEISDRNALDGDATILVPQSMLDAATKGILFDVYIRVLGKPNQCMTIHGYAYDSLTGYWLTGSLYISRKGGKSTFIKINEMFDVEFCATPPTCTPAETSVFADVFEDYFWSITNDGTRIVQVRIYPRSI